MRRPPAALIAITVALALALAACGDDDTTTTPAPTSATGATGPSEPSSGDAPQGDAEQVVRELTSCIEDEAGQSVIENPSSVGKAKYELVVNAGGVGVIYVFENAADAAAGQAAVETQETEGRTTEVVNQTVIAYFEPDQTLAPNPDELAEFRACAGAP